MPNNGLQWLFSSSWALLFIEKLISLLVQCMISFFSQNTQLWRSIFSLLLHKSTWFLLTVRWFESHYCLLSQVHRINNSSYIAISWRGQTFWLDGVMAASQNATIRVLAVFNLLVDLLVKCGDQLPARIWFVRSYSGTNMFRTIPKILADLLL